VIGLLIAIAAAGGGFVAARRFVKRRLRFVDALHKPAAPVIAGLGAAALAAPIALLPVVTLGTAIAFGVGVAGGVATGRRSGER
jgi:hypothetical protein